jgi:hypothetical protein
MSSPSAVQRSARFAIATGIGWISAGLISLALREPHRFLDVLLVAPIALQLGAAVNLHALQRDHSGRLGQMGYRALLFGTPVVLLGQVGIIAGSDLLMKTALPVGMLVWVPGLLLFGVATARARLLPRWIGVGIALSQGLAVLVGLALSPISPLANTGTYTGALAHGVVWLSFALALRARATDQQRAAIPSRQFA